MKKRKFLSPFAASVAALMAVSGAHAAANEGPQQEPSNIEVVSAPDLTVAGDEFVIERSHGVTIQTAGHRSHYSHRSHASHSSHRSHYSSGW